MEAPPAFTTTLLPPRNLTQHYDPRHRQLCAGVSPVSPAYFSRAGVPALPPSLSAGQAARAAAQNPPAGKRDASAAGADTLAGSHNHPVQSHGRPTAVPHREHRPHGPEAHTRMRSTNRSLSAACARPLPAPTSIRSLFPHAPRRTGNYTVLGHAPVPTPAARLTHSTRRHHASQTVQAFTAHAARGPQPEPRLKTPPYITTPGPAPPPAHDSVTPHDPAPPPDPRPRAAPRPRTASRPRAASRPRTAPDPRPRTSLPRTAPGPRLRTPPRPRAASRPRTAPSPRPRTTSPPRDPAPQDPSLHDLAPPPAHDSAPPHDPT